MSLPPLAVYAIEAFVLLNAVILMVTYVTLARAEVRRAHAVAHRPVLRRARTACSSPSPTPSSS